MNKIILTLAVAGLIVSACGGQGSKKKTAEQALADVRSKVENVATPSDSEVVVLTLKDGKGTVRVCKAENRTIYLQFESAGYKKLTGRLSSDDSTANIRFAQIFMLDGTMDGPFGRDMAYDLPSDGTYKVSVNENMMAGDPWAGEFTAEITLGK